MSGKTGALAVARIPMLTLVARKQNGKLRCRWLLGNNMLKETLAVAR